MSSPSRQKLERDLIFMARTMRTRQNVEQLLGPERHTNITDRDYNRALAFLPGPHRHYNTIGTVVGAVSGYSLRHRSWGAARLGGVVFFSALTGRAVGSAYAVFSFYRFLNGLENPDGFARALENVQHRLEQPGAIPAPQQSQDDSFSTPVYPETASSSPSSPAAPPAAPTSAWDRIRAANAQQTQQSSWDALRQSHERSRVPRPPQDGSSDNRFYDSDRAAEQAKFDELLEKERNFGK
ncbi:hypothetical protein CC1G_06784 [Coprinopsis cinerea okayama7|uniref:Uncharacterized protein n=1 Tax=Coprinopsis cinerea (strain Okayama-7 / 130 / ATCC MYA-4618 / FGSC 9003) TaxID=240176 RepID=A8N1M5_COPC7|nr:hypothetical protein CC1G_06784 [Coprinopsis cinerea okayama7\|eukprot:XP_001828798.1 hypothetical protein CC1G_06784 [Coprinopsis cinerea okayama7\